MESKRSLDSCLLRWNPIANTIAPTTATIPTMAPPAIAPLLLFDLFSSGVDSIIDVVRDVVVISEDVKKLVEIVVVVELESAVVGREEPEVTPVPEVIRSFPEVADEIWDVEMKLVVREPEVNGLVVIAPELAAPEVIGAEVSELLVRGEDVTSELVTRSEVSTKVVSGLVVTTAVVKSFDVIGAVLIGEDVI